MSVAGAAAPPAASVGTPALELEAVVFRWPGARVPVLDVPAFRLERGERLFLHGPSGSGKTTLLGVLAGVVRPERGRVRVLDQALHALALGRVDAFRAAHIGFIFQMFNLLPYLSVTDNVTLPARFSRTRRARAAAARRGPEDEAQRLLEHLGLGDPNLRRRPVTELSVGQQQRVAAARALYGAPEIIIADEPTSALDADTKAGFLRLLFEECGRAGSSLLLASHDRALAPAFDRSVGMAEINRADTDGVAP